jgi:prepilin-type N-terminal cleavage/methylation domain-containing protein
MKKTAGFTLVEITAVLVVIGIISLIVIANSFDFQEKAGSEAFYNQFKSHLQYARTKSLNSENNWGIGITESGYFLFSGSTSNKKHLPGEENLIVKSKSGKDISISGDDIIFDNFGHPFDPAGNIKEFDFSVGEDNSLKVYKTGYIK